MNDTMSQIKNWVTTESTRLYSIEDMEKDMARMRPRFLDIWVIPPLMIWLGLKQKSMHKWPRRMLFTAGAYMLMRNYGNYKTAVQSLASLTKSQEGA